MFYKFPIIEHLDQVREAIDGRTEFIIAEREWGFVSNYLVNLIDTFPYPNTKDEALNERYKIRRECRGIKFDLNGKPLARLFHKFHNYGERPEVDEKKVDFSAPFITLNKLDGSMIHPIYWNDNVHICTKMGLTDVATPVQFFVDRGEAMVDGMPITVNYYDFMRDMMNTGWTPIFEWCSRKQRIVVDYGEHDYLLLTAIRHMITGKYKTYDEMVELLRRMLCRLSSIGKACSLTLRSSPILFRTRRAKKVALCALKVVMVTVICSSSRTCGISSCTRPRNF